MEYKCSICSKNYSSYQSLWIHNKKYHNIKSSESHSNVIVCNRNVIDNKKEQFNPLSCKYCRRQFNARQNRWSHENICKIKQEAAIIKQEPKINNINKGVINNINTTNIIKFGTEDILNILTKKQISKILNSNYLVLEESIKAIHFNDKLPEYKNIKITNLRSNMALVHNGTKFNAVNQYNAVCNLVDNHVSTITQLLKETDINISERILERLGILIEKFNDDYKKFIDYTSNRTYKNFKDYKIDTVRTMIYNECK
jgi:hypothetical protein